MSGPLTLDTSGLAGFADEKELASLAPEAEEARRALLEGTGRGSDFLGWVRLPFEAEKSLPALQEAAERLRESCRTVVCVGIGGSYLGTRAAAEALGTRGVSLAYAGHHLSSTSLSRLMAGLDPKATGLIVISKSGTTTEPAVAFRILRKWLEDAVGEKKAAERILAVTDRAKGALKALAGAKGYATFTIPDDVGGRYSVLTPVGLLPLAAAGVDVEALVAGAQEAARRAETEPFESNPALRYAAARNLALHKGKSVEVLACWRPELHTVAEWWKQLFGESEGKEGKGLFPASVDFTTDLHSLGQYLQEGQRLFLETMLWVEREDESLEIPGGEDDGDGLSELAGKPLSFVNEKAMLGTTAAHRDGGVPVLSFRLPVLDARALGHLFQTFEFAGGVSGYLLGVNPFDQPGVEAYKRNMFALLGRKGFEKTAAELRAKGIG